MLSRRVALGGLAAFIATPALAQTPAFHPQHDQYAAALDLLANRRWRDLVGLIAGLPAQSAKTLLTDLGDGAPIAEDLNAMARVRGGSGVAGAIRVGWAWRYRGSDVGIVNEDAFGRHLVGAVENLMTAIDDDASDGVSTACLFQALKGAGEKSLLEGYLPIYLAASRKPVQGLSIYADAISSKWVGSEAESLAFARRYSNSAPAASYGVIADAHITSAVARAMSDSAQEAASADTYFAQPAVIEEIVAAHDRFAAATADSDRYAVMLAHAQFSFAFLQIGDEARLRQHLVGQGDYSGGPWQLDADPPALLGRVQRALGISPT